MINLADFTLNLKGKVYLPVAPRIAYFAEVHPDWSITTEVVVVEDTPRMVRATVSDEAGRVRATAHKTVVPFDGGAVEKAETGAIGRALSMVGIGTLLALDMDEGDQTAEAPVEQPSTDVPPTDDELATIVAFDIPQLRAAYLAAHNAGRLTFAEAISKRAEALKAATTSDAGTPVNMSDLVLSDLVRDDEPATPADQDWHLTPKGDAIVVVDPNGEVFDPAAIVIPAAFWAKSGAKVPAKTNPAKVTLLELARGGEAGHGALTALAAMPPSDDNVQQFARVAGLVLDWAERQ